MVQYYVMLKHGSHRPDTCVFYDESRERAVEMMTRYCKNFGFSFIDSDGRRYSIRDLVLVEKEPIAGAPILSETSYYKLKEVIK